MNLNQETINYHYQSALSTGVCSSSMGQTLSKQLYFGSVSRPSDVACLAKLRIPKTQIKLKLIELMPYQTMPRILGCRTSAIHDFKCGRRNRLLKAASQRELVCLPSNLDSELV